MRGSKCCLRMHLCAVVQVCIKIPYCVLLPSAWCCSFAMSRPLLALNTDLLHPGQVPGAFLEGSTGWRASEPLGRARMLRDGIRRSIRVTVCQATRQTM